MGIWIESECPGVQDITIEEGDPYCQSNFEYMCNVIVLK